MNEYTNKAPQTKKAFGYKRNKNEIEKEILYNNKIYTIAGVLPASYNKALIYAEKEGFSKKGFKKIILMSYKTIVCEITPFEQARFFDYYSFTTAQHINTFLKMFNFLKEDKILYAKDLRKGGFIDYDTRNF